LAGAHRQVAETKRPDETDLIRLGLRIGEPVRWRNTAGARWQFGSITRRERDGSMGITDQRGMARSLPVERLEVTYSGGRGATRWEPLAVRLGRSEQLRLL
jgi:hypothetical protein